MTTRRRLSDTLGAVIMRARRMHNWDQETLARFVGVTREHISRIENNRARPHPNTLLLLAEVLALDYNELAKLSAQAMT